MTDLLTLLEFYLITLFLGLASLPGYIYFEIYLHITYFDTLFLLLVSSIPLHGYTTELIDTHLSVETPVPPFVWTYTFSSLG